MTENEIGKIVVDAAYRVHSRLGPGLLESVYEATLAYELRKRCLSVRRQVAIPIRYDDLEFEEGFRVDLIVEDLVIVEIKSVEALNPVHGKQLLTYLRLADKRLGVPDQLWRGVDQSGMHRIVNGAEDWGTRRAKDAPKR